MRELVSLILLLDYVVLILVFSLQLIKKLLLRKPLIAKFRVLMTLLLKNKSKILKKLPTMAKLFHSNQIDLN